MKENRPDLEGRGDFQFSLKNLPHHIMMLNYEARGLMKA